MRHTWYSSLLFFTISGWSRSYMCHQCLCLRPAPDKLFHKFWRTSIYWLLCQRSKHFTPFYWYGWKYPSNTLNLLYYEHFVNRILDRVFISKLWANNNNYDKVKLGRPYPQLVRYLLINGLDRRIVLVHSKNFNFKDPERVWWLSLTFILYRKNFEGSTKTRSRSKPSIQCLLSEQRSLVDSYFILVLFIKTTPLFPQFLL